MKVISLLKCRVTVFYMIKGPILLVCFWKLSDNSEVTLVLNSSDGGQHLAQKVYALTSHRMPRKSDIPNLLAD